VEGASGAALQRQGCEAPLARGDGRRGRGDQTHPRLWLELKL